MASDVTITGEAAIGSVLTGSYTYSDADGNRESILSHSNAQDIVFDSNGAPYIVTEDKKYTRLKKFENNQRTNIRDGVKGKIGGLAFDTANVPYAISYAWSDELQTETPIVMKLDGDAWTNIGDPFTGKINEIQFD
jgi:hypothetical protein